MFVDTNVLLDLYRARGDSTLKALTALLQSPGKIVGTFQVEAEFYRNRIAVVDQSLRELDKGLNKPPLPAMLAETQALKMYEKAVTELNERKAVLKAKLADAMREPTGKDEAAKLANRFFTLGGPLVLSASDERVEQMVRRARDRVDLGNPPKKPGDSTLGDAINWEWCLEACRLYGKDLVIVTRDGDYGVKLDGDILVSNTYLDREFKRVVSRKRKLVITNSVNRALKLLGVNVKDEEVAKESAEAEVAAISRPAVDRPDELQKRLRLVSSPEREYFLRMLLQRVADSASRDD